MDPMVITVLCLASQLVSCRASATLRVHCPGGMVDDVGFDSVVVSMGRSGTLHL